MFLNLALFGSLVIIGALGAPASKDNCTMADNFQGLACGMRAVDFGEKIENLDLEDKAEMKEFKRSCDALNGCVRTLGHCKAFQDDEVKTGFASIKMACAMIDFVDSTFKACDAKLDAKNLTCYDDWDPFQNNKDFKIKEKVEATCKNYFGIGNCLKKEITENCGAKEWEMFKDHMLELDQNGKKQCDFKGIV